jgi:two-component system, NarL family, sensor histidine kinase UhpB
MTETALAGFSGFGSLDADQLGRLVDQLPMIVWHADRDLHVRSLRGGGLATLGLLVRPTPDQRVGDNIDNSQERARVIAAHRTALRGTGTTYEITMRGRTFSARVEPLHDAGGAIAGVVGMSFDITERRRAEDALREGEARLRTIIESEPECVKLVDHEGRLLEMNPAGLAMIEADAIDQVRGHLIVDVVSPQHRAAFLDLHRRVFDGEAGTLEFEITGLKGRRRWLATHAVPLRDAAGAVQALLGMTRDITETRQAEEQLRASRAALRSLATRQQDIREDERTRIAREIHDSLGQALTALKLHLAAAQDATAREAPSFGTRLSETTAMVDDLVKMVRRIATELRPPILDQLGLPAALEWLAQDFSHRTGIVCKTAIMPTNGAISHELATTLFRIVQEGLTNISRHARASEVQIGLGIKSQCVTLEISDDGRGITEAATTGPGSLGILGMRERAAAFGGVLEVVPRGGGGTRITAWFPPLPNGGASGAER